MAKLTLRAAFVATSILALGILSGSLPATAQDNAATTEPATPPAAGPDPKLVVAKLNGADITRQDVLDSARNLPPQVQQNIDQLFPQLLDRLVFLKLVSAKGRADGLADDPEVKAIVDQYMAEVQENAIREIFFKRAIEAKVTDAAVETRYTEEKTKFEEEAQKAPAVREIDASHILVATEDEAKAIIADLKAGGDFAAIAKEKSTDKASGKNGGELGWFSQGDMVKEFGDAAFAMKKGDTSETPVKTQFGFHVIHVNDERNKPARAFDKSKEDVRIELTEELRKEIAKSLKDEAKVEILEPTGGITPAQ